MESATPHADVLSEAGLMAARCCCFCGLHADTLLVSALVTAVSATSIPLFLTHPSTEGLRGPLGKLFGLWPVGVSVTLLFCHVATHTGHYPSLTVLALLLLIVACVLLAIVSINICNGTSALPSAVWMYRVGASFNFAACTCLSFLLCQILRNYRRHMLHDFELQAKTTR